MKRLNIPLQKEWKSDGGYVDDYLMAVYPNELFQKYVRVAIIHKTKEIILVDREQIIKEFTELLKTKAFKRLCDKLMGTDKVSDIEEQHIILETVFLLSDEASYYVSAIDFLWDVYMKFDR